MIINASGRTALIVVTGLLVLCVSPIRAETASAADPKSESATTPSALHRGARHATHHRKFYAHRKYHAVAAKAADDKETVADAPAGNGKTLPDIPPSIANANAQMLLAGVQSSAAAAIPPGNDTPTASSNNPSGTRSDNETFIVASDQLNDVDKALHDNSPQPTVVANPPPGPNLSSDNTVWDQTSLIGKVFIGFGALLTMASAARMFMA